MSAETQRIATMIGVGLAILLALGNGFYTAGVLSTKVDRNTTEIILVQTAQKQVQEIQVEQAVQGGDISTLKDDVGEIKKSQKDLQKEIRRAQESVKEDLDKILEAVQSNE
jgi:peptidoglycan hydrolase CwlO-like protein